MTGTTPKIRQYKLIDTKSLALAICSLEGVSKLQALFLPCPFKSLTGIDCPGCGFQRSLYALIEGNWAESYHLYPPTVPLLALALFALAKWCFGFDKRDVLMKIGAVAVGWFVIGTYLAKILANH